MWGAGTKEEKGLTEFGWQTSEHVGLMSFLLKIHTATSQPFIHMQACVCGGCKENPFKCKQHKLLAV